MAKILTVVKTRFVGNIITRILSRNGHDNEVVLTFEDAIVEQEKQHYDLILFQAEAGDKISFQSFVKHSQTKYDTLMLGMHLGSIREDATINRITGFPAIVIPFYESDLEHDVEVALQTDYKKHNEILKEREEQINKRNHEND